MLTYLSIFLTDESQCSYIGSEYEGNVHFFLECQDTLNRERTFLATKRHYCVFHIKLYS